MTRATIMAVLLSAVASFPVLAQAGGGDTPTPEEAPERVTCEEVGVDLRLLCVAYQVIADDHVDPVDDALLAREAADRIREENLAERTGGTPPACPLPAPEFEEVCREIDAVEDTAKAVEMAIRGMVRALEDNSYLYTIAQHRRFRDNIENRGTTGLGLAFALDDNGEPCFEVSASCAPVISEVYAGSPAEAAGLMVGDVLVELGDAYPAQLGCDAVAGLDRFPSGVEIALTVRRDGATVSKTIEAARLAIPPARGWIINGEVGLLRLDSFTAKADENVQEALHRLTDVGISGLVFDLRGNPGGYVDPAVGVAGLFLPNMAPIVELVTRETVETVSARSGGLYPDPVLLPMVVVTDNRSASASEMVTGALRDNRRVIVVGERTYGKHTGQSSYQLEVNEEPVAVLHLTTLRWLTPASRSAADGFEPDVEMELPRCLPPSEVALRAVSAIRPRVAGIAITTTPRDGVAYLAGETVTVAVSFTSPVVVVPDGAAPQLEIRVGDRGRPALYKSGSGTARLLFDYQVSENLSDEDGISIDAGSILTGRARIQLPVGLEAILSHGSVPPDLGQLVAVRSEDAGEGIVRFVDIAGNVHQAGIARIAAAGITAGCGDPGSGRFCPDDPVTRAQVATLLARALDLPAGDLDHYTDDNGVIHENSINRLAAAGITRGCGNNNYCPHQPITRAQVATLLARALDLPAGDLDHYTDDNGVIHENSINRLAAAGITAGCGDSGSRRFCPDDPVTRAQMATLLARILDLLTVEPPTGPAVAVTSGTASL